MQQLLHIEYFVAIHEYIYIYMYVHIYKYLQLSIHIHKPHTHIHPSSSDNDAYNALFMPQIKQKKTTTITTNKYSNTYNIIYIMHTGIS